MSERASNPRNRLAGVEREILEEIASQSGRYGERLDALLGEMTALRQAVETALAQRPTDSTDVGGASDGVLESRRRLPLLPHPGLPHASVVKV